jgi:hypothetical protein
VVLGFDIEYGVQSKRAALSVSRPRTVKDEEGEQALILESVRDREANVRLSDYLFLTKKNSSLIVLCPALPGLTLFSTNSPSRQRKPKLQHIPQVQNNG